MSDQLLATSTHTLKQIMETSVTGLGRFLLGVPVEHVFDRLKTHSQAHLSNQPMTKLALSLCRQFGVRQGLFAGFQSNFIIQVMKQYYRWPMMVLLPSHIKQILPTRIMDRFPLIHKVFTGISIGLLESCLITPLERIKCQMMTSERQIQASSLKFSEISSLLSLKSLLQAYRGFTATCFKQTISWVSYLYWDHKSRHLFKNDFYDALTIPQIFMSAMITGVMNVATVQPFDTIKTLQQMDQGASNAEKSLPKLFMDTFQRKGLPGLYSGYQIRLSQFFVQSLLTVPVMDFLERTYTKRTQP